MSTLVIPHAFEENEQNIPFPIYNIKLKSTKVRRLDQIDGSQHRVIRAKELFGEVGVERVGYQKG